MIPWNQNGSSPTGSLSDRYARFFDSVYSVLAQTAPQAWVTAYAYEQYRDPPVDYTIKGNVMMGYVGFTYPALPTETAADKKHWGGWQSAGAKRLFWRPNCLIAGDSLPYMFPSAIAKVSDFPPPPPAPPKHNRVGWRDVLFVAGLQLDGRAWSGGDRL